MLTFFLLKNILHHCRVLVSWYSLFLSWPTVIFSSILLSSNIYSILWSSHRYKQVIHRLAPFERGVFEDYVANFWCSTSMLIKWKRIFSISTMRFICSIATILAFFPSFVQQIKSPSDLGFLYSLLNSSFSFYLFSYQGIFIKTSSC